MMAIPSFSNPQLAAVFAHYPPKLRTKLLALRQLIFEVAAKTPGIGPLEETLKWGPPAYLTSQTRSGSTIRIDRKRSEPNRYAIYFHCQTDLMARFRKLFGPSFEFEGNRAIVSNGEERLPKRALAQCIAMALTYHLKRRRRSLYEFRKIYAGKTSPVP